MGWKKLTTKDKDRKPIQKGHVHFFVKQNGKWVCSKPSCGATR